MPKTKSKIAILEGESNLSNKDLAQCLDAVIYNNLGGDGKFKLTQKPKVQEVKAPKSK